MTEEQPHVYNLLSNALKFTPENGKIIFHASKVDRERQVALKLKVKDFGRGIPAKDIEQIFDNYLAILPQDGLPYYCLGDYYRAYGDYRKAADYDDQAARLGLPDAHQLAQAVREDTVFYEIENEKGGWE